METGTTSRLSGNVTYGTSAGNYVGALTSDGSAAVFYSEMPLIADDTTGSADVYLWRRG